MLYLIGIGIHDEKDISLKGLEAARKCSQVYAEFYTSPIQADIENLGNLIGKQVVVLERKDVEETKEFLKEAGKKDIALLVAGDPLSATTHNEIILEARKNGIKVGIIHSSSIFTSIAESGLSLYRFGQAVSLPRPEKNYFPISPYEKIHENLQNKLHTLLLLDIGMRANEGLEYLEELENKIGKGLFRESSKVIIVAHLGKNSTIKYGKIRELKKENFGDLPHSILIPAKLEFYEQEFLEQFRV